MSSAPVSIPSLPWWAELNRLADDEGLADDREAREEGGFGLEDVGDKADTDNKLEDIVVNSDDSVDEALTNILSMFLPGINYQNTSLAVVFPKKTPSHPGLSIFIPYIHTSVILSTSFPSFIPFNQGICYSSFISHEHRKKTLVPHLVLFSLSLSSSSIPSSPHPYLTSTPWKSPPPPSPTRTTSGSPSDDPDPKPRKRSKPSLDENKEPRFDENKAQIFRLKLTHAHLQPNIYFWICRYKERRWDLKQLIGFDEMPSSHLAIVTSLATAVGFHDDFGGSPFATALVLACIVMYDAFGVRLHVGCQVEVLNQTVYELPVEHPLAESKPLRELLWHTRTQVIAGSFLGLVTVIVGHFIVASGTAHD
ncbi:uncharacterized protein LOC131317339 [Rhododendron vialii]|uniref:uncharacterized protein LOC131317339 n=1 Tax=Rhododendron vialii TaxID=182163 RepID=UPI00265F5E40|nr:uncharacterized protein LOC131317339 [Rhododendron vialii]